MPPLPDAPWAQQLPNAPWTPPQESELEKPLPRPFLERVKRGLQLDSGEPFTEDDAHDVALGRPGPAHLDAFEVAAAKTQRKYPQEERGLGIGPYVLRGLAGGMAESLASLPQRALEEAGGLQRTGGYGGNEAGTPESGKFTNEGMPAGFEAALLTLGTGTKFARTTLEGKQVVGQVPKAEDFKTAADFVSDKDFSAADRAVTRLQALWDERGIHPAEAVHDAKSDAFLRHDLTSPIEAFHGSPHSFDSFSMEKIGTGEGAQSYGYGLYFAENEGVAKSYQNMEQRKLDWTSTDPGQAPPGNMFQVRIWADKEHFLDWDKPLSEQSERVQKAMAPIIKEFGLAGEDAKYLAGTHIINRMAETLSNGASSSPAVTAALREAGIPGIKYLDQGSRFDPVAAKQQVVEAERTVREHEIGIAKGEDVETRKVLLQQAKEDVTRLKAIDDTGQTHNYVVFDDKLVEITHKNGEAVAKPYSPSTEVTSLPPVDTPMALRPVGAEVSRVEQISQLIRDGKTPEEIIQELGINVPPSWAGHGDMKKLLIVELSRLGVPVTKIMDVLEGKPHPLGADVVGTASTPPPTPAAPPGRLLAAAKSAIKDVLEIRNDIQMKTDPMSMGTDRAQAPAKDFANSLRRNRWDHARYDDMAVKEFTPEQRKRMYDASDEESVARQLGESLEHQGLVTLEPKERLYVEVQHERAQLALQHAKDAGVFEGEGLPAYTPRMVINIAEHSEGKRPRSLNGSGNLHVTTPQMRLRKYMTAEETEAAAKAAFGDEAKIARDIRTLPLSIARLEDAVAGRTLINEIERIGKEAGEDTVSHGTPFEGSFTIDHPAFRKWKPRFEKDEAGTTTTLKDAAGNVIFEQVQIHVSKEFEGPLKAVLTQKDGALYSAIMDIKGKTMGLIMNSPLIHNLVIAGKALPAVNGNIYRLGKMYFEGNRVKNDVAMMHDFLDAGGVPIGKRFFNQDINSIMEAPDLSAGRSWTAKVAGYMAQLDSALPESMFLRGKLTGEQAAAQELRVKTAIDKAGDFWHNTLLWDRVGDLQMGIYKDMRERLVKAGVYDKQANYIAAHFANRFAGAIPQEAMSAGSRKFLNFALFSRSFTSTNIGIFKDALTGLPGDVAAQIERDFGAIDPAAKDFAKSVARRKALATIGADIALYYVGNSLLQNAANVMFNDSTWSEEMHGYARRFREAVQKRIEHPLSLMQPIDFLEGLSATHDNEPGKQGRIHVGYDKNGTAIYANNPTGKFAAELIDWMDGPLDLMRRKQGTIARPLWQIYSNDKGFGRKVFDPNAHTPLERAGAVFDAIAHIMKAQTPEGQLRALGDLLMNEGDQKVNALQAFGPMGGVTFSRGAPGGPAVGEMYHLREEDKYKMDLAMPDLRKQIARGDLEGAQQRMQELHFPKGYQKFILRTSVNPASRLSGPALRQFYQSATPEQRERMERVRPQ